MTFLTLKVVSESVTCDVGNLCHFNQGLSVPELGSMYATDRLEARTYRLMPPGPPPYGGGGITSCAGGRHNMPRPLQLDLLTLKVVS